MKNSVIFSRALLAALIAGIVGGIVLTQTVQAKQGATDPIPGTSNGGVKSGGGGKKSTTPTPAPTPAPGSPAPRDRDAVLQRCRSDQRSPAGVRRVLPHRSLLSDALAHDG